MLIGEIDSFFFHEFKDNVHSITGKRQIKVVLVGRFLGPVVSFFQSHAVTLSTYTHPEDFLWDYREGGCETDVFIFSMDIRADLLRSVITCAKKWGMVLLYTATLSPKERKKAVSLVVDDVLYDEMLQDEEFWDRFRFLCDFSKLRRLGLLDGMKERPDFIPVYQAGRRKRIIDILVSSVALVALFPVIVLISVMILIESGWPIFYISKRVGSGYHVFNFYKFRTMRKNADRELGNLSKNNQYDSGEMGFVKIANDPRVTKLGAFLRKTSLDELPQLVNVLKGDMSLVGNRPLPLYEAATLTKDEWALRFLAPAGLTGLWQVSKRGKKEMSADERMSLDIQYAREGSMRLDFEIIFRTFSAMMQEEQV